MKELGTGPDTCQKVPPVGAFGEEAPLTWLYCLRPAEHEGRHFYLYDRENRVVLWNDDGDYLWLKGMK